MHTPTEKGPRPRRRRPLPAAAAAVDLWSLGWAAVSVVLNSEDSPLWGGRILTANPAWFPHRHRTDTQRANTRDLHPPRLQNYQGTTVSLSKIRNRDNDFSLVDWTNMSDSNGLRGRGVDSKDTGPRDGIGYHLDLVCLPILVVVTMQCWRQHPTPVSCLLPLNRPSLTLCFESLRVATSSAGLPSGLTFGTQRAWGLKEQPNTVGRARAQP